GQESPGIASGPIQIGSLHPPANSAALDSASQGGPPSPAGRRPRCQETRGRASPSSYFFFDFCASFSASPRMSPSDAPESDEPYWATACFSSAIWSALIEKFGFFERSKPVT